MSRRTVIAGVVALLVLTPCLGFAGGDVALHIWNKYPRHAKAHHDEGPHIAWKIVPGSVVSFPTMAELDFAGFLVSSDPIAVPSVVPRPPFVPPRA
jgi:hypothetical protein